MFGVNATEHYDNPFRNVSVEKEVDPTLIFGPDRDPLYIVIPITIIYATVFVSGIMGNILTCAVIVKHNSMHTATNYYLFSLAMSDLLLLVSGLPQEMYSIWSKWPYVFGSAFCLIRGLAAETSTNASILTIVLFTMERYSAICHPFRSHTMSKLSRATKHIVLLWIVAFALALPQALQFGLRTHSGVVMCLQTRVIIEHSFEISTFVLFMLPMVLITVLYLLIAVKLKETSNEKMRKSLKANASLVDQTNKSKKSTRRVIKMLVAVVLAFFVCWAPFHAQRLVAIYGTTEHHRPTSDAAYFLYIVLTYVSGVFYYISTCINPILYHLMSNKFREAFKAFMCRGGRYDASSLSQAGRQRQLGVSRDQPWQSLVARRYSSKNLQISTALKPSQSSLKICTPYLTELPQVVSPTTGPQQILRLPFPFI